MLQLLGLSLSGAIILLDSTAAFQVLIAQPLFACPFLGLIGGNIELGFQMGFLLQLIWLANMPIGAAVIPEGEIGSIAGLILALRLIQRLPQLEHFIMFIALLYALFVSYLGAKSVTFIRNRNQHYLQHILHRLNLGERVKMGWVIVNSLLFSALVFFVIIFVLTVVFENALYPVLKSMPLSLANRIGLIGKISILGVGMGLTVTLLKDRKFWPLYLLGMLIGGGLILYGTF
jgi:mannose/fructose/N-acetylgalactosamine-specific phosphotransferase system component IIC